MAQYKVRANCTIHCDDEDWLVPGAMPDDKVTVLCHEGVHMLPDGRTLQRWSKASEGLAHQRAAAAVLAKLEMMRCVPGVDLVATWKAIYSNDAALAAMMKELSRKGLITLKGADYCWQGVDSKLPTQTQEER